MIPATSQPLRSTPALRKLVTGLMLLLAFMFMASVFTPDLSRAGAPREHFPGVPPRPVDPHSVDAHEALRSLGVIEDRQLRIHVYATSLGPRFTIREASTGQELGTLLSVEQVQLYFPELQLPRLETQSESPLMMVDPLISSWQP